MAIFAPCVTFKDHKSAYERIYIYIYIYIYKSKCGVASGTIHIKDIIYVEKEQHKRARLPLGFYSPKGTLYL